MKVICDTRMKNRCFLIVVIALSGWILPTQCFGESRLIYDSVAIDSLDADAWNGIVFQPKAFNQQVPFAIRIGSRSGEFLDGEQIFDAVREVGAHAPRFLLSCGLAALSSPGSGYARMVAH